MPMPISKYSESFMFLFRFGILGIWSFYTRGYWSRGVGKEPGIRVSLEALFLLEKLIGYIWD